MGCDIHWHVEVQLDDGTWVRGEPMVPQTWEPEDYFTHRCKTCGEQVFQLGNPYTELMMGPGSTDEQVADMWRKMRDHLEANSPARDDYQQYYEGIAQDRKIAILDMAFAAIKHREIRAVTSLDEADQLGGIYHVETNSSDCQPPYEGKAELRPNLVRGDFYSGRNYELFALLSGVRGNAPDEGQLLDQDGLPEDVCDEIANEFQAWGSDAHSEGWATLARLMEYPWYTRYKEFRIEAWVSDPDNVSSIEYFLSHIRENPATSVYHHRDRISHAQITEGGDSYSLDHQLAGRDAARPDRAPDVTVKCSVPLAHTDFSHFMETLTKMATLAPAGDMNRVRVIAWYDN